MVDPIVRDAYRGKPPWDIGRAQPAFVELANAGLVTGSVLDVGCGTGENALEMAERGHEAWGIDIVERAIDQARAKAKLRSLAVHFEVQDALDLAGMGHTWDTIIDCGLFHTFSDPERELYERQLRAVLRPGGMLHILAMSDQEDRSWGGPRRITQQEILETFSDGWRVDDIQEARFVVLPQFRIKGHAWLSTIVREDSTPAKKKRAARANPPRKKSKEVPKPLPMVTAGGATVEVTR